ncbi:MAG: hypothetical protein H6662_16230 [Ardenticatenaceae bacterium]|nr:hypothetical protein [Anaerolineales bacterium]MCB8923135.1 hypothetical protein [Ardenticatenaceae bacterium]MCB9005216.1 hypothetical protein [Ardenticatenaceae bacterium]
MPKRFSDVVGVTTEELWAEGAFDAFVDIDARFHIDPHLLEKTAVPELQGAYQKVQQRFEDVLHLLAYSQKPGDFYYKKAKAKLLFRELRFISLGYSKGERKNRAKGKGIGSKLADQLTTTAAEIVKVGIKDPKIFELVGLLEEGIGADRISDMMARIIIVELLQFTERVSQNLELKTWPIDYKGKSYQIPLTPQKREPIVFVPHEILRPLPIAFDWTDLDVVRVYNAELRETLNDDIGITWKDATNLRKISKEKLKEILLADRDLFDDLLTQYEAKPATPYDYESDPDGGLIWYRLAEEWAEKYPALLDDIAVVTPEVIHEVVVRICNHFGRLLEHDGLSVFLFNDDGRLRREGYARLLFYGLADAYCRANNLDLSLEAKWGRELVMFKISRGFRARVFVAVKYSRNGHLVQQYETAIEHYHWREGQTVYLVIQTAKSEGTLAALKTLKQEAQADGKPVPELLIYDGRLNEVTQGVLWEIGADDDRLIEAAKASQKQGLTAVSDEVDDESLELRARRLSIRPFRLERWDTIIELREQHGLTQSQIAERLVQDVVVIKRDCRDMRRKEYWNWEDVP